MSTKPIPVTTRINKVLRKQGSEFRFIRGQGYYYVTGVVVSSSLPVYRLDPTEHDYILARDHVNEVLRNEHELCGGTLIQIKD